MYDPADPTLPVPDTTSSLPTFTTVSNSTPVASTAGASTAGASTAGASTAGASTAVTFTAGASTAGASTAGASTAKDTASVLTRVLKDNSLSAEMKAAMLATLTASSTGQGIQQKKELLNHLTKQV